MYITPSVEPLKAIYYGKKKKKPFIAQRLAPAKPAESYG